MFNLFLSFFFFLCRSRRFEISSSNKAKFIGWPRLSCKSAVATRVLSSHAKQFAWSFAAGQVKILHITGRNFIFVFTSNRGSFNIPRVRFSTINFIGLSWTKACDVTVERWPVYLINQVSDVETHDFDKISS